MDTASGWVVVGIDNGGNSNNATILDGSGRFLVDRLVGPSRKIDELSESVLQGMLEGLAKRIPALPAGVWVGPREPSKKKALVRAKS